jgi:hypothetical protein
MDLTRMPGSAAAGCSHAPLVRCLFCHPFSIVSFTLASLTLRVCSLAMRVKVQESLHCENEKTRRGGYSQQGEEENRAARDDERRKG